MVHTDSNSLRYQPPLVYQQAEQMEIDQFMARQRNLDQEFDYAFSQNDDDVDHSFAQGSRLGTVHRVTAWPAPTRETDLHIDAARHAARLGKSSEALLSSCLSDNESHIDIAKRLRNQPAGRVSLPKMDPPSEEAEENDIDLFLSGQPNNIGEMSGDKTARRNVEHKTESRREAAAGDILPRQSRNYRGLEGRLRGIDPSLDLPWQA